MRGRGRKTSRYGMGRKKDNSLFDYEGGYRDERVKMLIDFCTRKLNRRSAQTSRERELE